MTEIGKRIRLERIFNRKTGRTVIAPMDHGVSSGPIKGIINMDETVESIAQGGANAILMHKGIVGLGHRGYGKDIGLIVHLSASTSLSPDPNNKVTVTSVEKAIQLGADAVSVHVNTNSSGCTWPFTLEKGKKVNRVTTTMQMYTGSSFRSRRAENRPCRRQTAARTSIHPAVMPITTGRKGMAIIGG